MVAVKPKSVVIRFQICIFDTLNTAVSGKTPLEVVL